MGSRWRERGLGVACAPPRKIQKSFHGGVELRELVDTNPDELGPLIVPIRGSGGALAHRVNGWTSSYASIGASSTGDLPALLPGAPGK